MNKILLVIIIVVVLFVAFLFLAVYGLIFAGLTLQITGSGSGIPETNSHAAWKVEQPFGIIDWDKRGDTLTLILKNNTREILAYTSISVAGKSNSEAAEIIPAATKTVKISGLDLCSTGNKFAYPNTEIIINYETASVPRKQIGNMDIVGTCS